MHHSQLTVVLVAIMMLSLLWGSSFIAIKIIVDEVQPLASFGMRFFIAGLLLIATHYIFLHIIYRRSDKKDYQSNQIKNRQLWKGWLLAALFFIVGGQGLLALGAQYLSSGAAAL
ncbi:MAG: EamA family transporter, partial [Nitrososphaeraceae archaeon]